MPLLLPQMIYLQWWGDASTSFGISIVISGYWAVWKWSPGFWVGPKLTFNISWAEVVVVELGFHLAIHLSLFDTPDQSLHVFFIHSNNLGVVIVMNKGQSCSKEMNQILKHIYLLQAHHCIHLQKFMSQAVTMSLMHFQGET